ncbi:ATP-binding protein [Falsihalocynthiibacter sp. SS001]|uniref:sensor histidine kinase n=1 Tax=Falsihalocynthiibacter sp. SS001 TaxID=3349698 RepID=UPI0036D3081A
MTRKFRVTTFVAAIILLLASVLLVAESLFRNAEIDRAQARLNLYQSTLTDALERYRHLPDVLAKTQFVRSGTQGVDLDVLNQRLAEIAAQTNLEAIYLMDRTGLTVAASNYAEDVTFLGKNYGFRPYFLEAMRGLRGQFFAIGVTTDRPGYFISSPVRDHRGEVAGVIALKVDLSELTNVWAEAQERLFVSNPDDVIVLASDDRWRYRTLEELTPERRAQIALERQFSDAPLDALNWHASQNNTARLAGRHYLHLTREFKNPKWTLHFLVPESQVWFKALTTLGAATGVVLFLAVVGLILRTRRVRSVLTASQAHRRKLQTVNAALHREIEERRAAELRVQQAQKELAQAHKLAALGQLSASVTHELGQPISAMKNYLTAAEIGASENDLRLVSRMSRLVARMEAITKELRFFARPTPVEFETFTLARLWEGTETLMRPDLDLAGITLNCTLPEGEVRLKGNRLRLEQVLVNLIKNAMSAVEETGDKRININSQTTDDHIKITVSDFGPGLNGRAMADLSEPFHTTRASGEGMGLGLAISAEIAKEHGGELSLQETEIGACFVLLLPKSEAPNAPE